MTVKIGIDVGGTFTDAAATVDGKLIKAKSYSTKDVTTGILNVLEVLARNVGMEVTALLPQVEKFILGNTVVTNAIDEARLRPVGLLTTAGFRDTLQIARSARSRSRDSHEMHPRPEIVPRRNIIELHERVDSAGTVLREVREDEVIRAVQRLVEQGAEAVAVCLLWSPRNPHNEAIVGRLIRSRFPQLPVSVSSELVPIYREYERTVTTVLDAAVKPIVADHFDTLAAALSERGLASQIKIMQVDGGFVSIDEATKAPIKMFNSGPAGGVEGARRLGKSLNATRVLTADMGGTSFDAAVIIDGECRVVSRAQIGEFPTALTAVDIASIGSGGGSLAWIDSRNVLRVGPESAGSEPGPACYGKGGSRPTVTDASVVLGLIDPEYFLGGKIQLDRDAASKAIRHHIAVPLGLSEEAAAAGIHQLAIHQMSNAIRMLTVNRGHDPREFTMVSFGGAGGLFAAAIAKLCHVKQLVIPTTASVFSAYGLLNADSLLTVVQTAPEPLSGNLDVLEAVYRQLTDRVLKWFEEDAIPETSRVIEREADMKFAGQIFDITARLPLTPLDPSVRDQVRAAFIRDYEEEFGADTAWTDAEILVTNLRVKGRGKFTSATAAITATADLPVEKTTRRIVDPLEGKAINIPVYRVFPADTVMHGPFLIEEPDTTIYVPAGAAAQRDKAGNYIVNLCASDAAAVPEQILEGV